MKIAKIILISLYGISLLASAHNHGKDRTGKNSFWASLIAVMIELGLLWWGGFFG